MVIALTIIIPFLNVVLTSIFPSFQLNSISNIPLSNSRKFSFRAPSKIGSNSSQKLSSPPRGSRVEAQSFNLSRIPRSFSFLFRQHVAFNWYVSKEGQRGNGKQKYPRGWRPLSRFNEACSCRRWSGAVSSDKVPTCSTRGPTLLQRDIRENCLALLLLLRFLLHQPNLDSANTPRTSLRIDTNRASQIYVSSLGRHDDIMTFDESYVSRRSNCLFRFSSRPSRTLSS